MNTVFNSPPRPQGRGAGKKGGGGHPNRAGGQHAARGQKGPHGNKRFK